MCAERERQRKLPVSHPVSKEMHSNSLPALSNCRRSSFQSRGFRIGHLEPLFTDEKGCTQEIVYRLSSGSCVLVNLQDMDQSIMRYSVQVLISVLTDKLEKT